jgi:hypothetical protein
MENPCVKQMAETNGRQPSSTRAGPALVNATVSHDGRVAEIALSGPAGAWFG